MIPHSQRFASALPALFLLTFWAPTSKAAPMTFGVENYSDAGISTTGALLGALNVGATETVNTVPFTGITTGYTNPIAFAGGVTLDAFGGGGAWYDCGAPGPLTNDFFYTAGAGTGYLTFSGLTEGQAYALQLVMSDIRDFNLDIWGDQADSTGLSDLSVDHGNSAPKLVTVTFTADSTGTKSLYIEVLADYPGHFNALQLRAIPPDGPFEISSITKAGAETTIVFESTLGATYIIEFSFDLINWLEITDSFVATELTTASALRFSVGSAIPSRKATRWPAFSATGFYRHRSPRFATLLKFAKTRSNRAR